jgi:hypothetical protein
MTQWGDPNGCRGAQGGGDPFLAWIWAINVFVWTTGRPHAHPPTSPRIRMAVTGRWSSSACQLLPHQCTHRHCMRRQQGHVACIVSQAIARVVSEPMMLVPKVLGGPPPANSPKTQDP